MALQARAGFVGLITAVAETGAPAGALRVADNVTLRREGALCQRESFLQTTTLSRQYAAAYPYKGSYFYRGTDSAPYTGAQNLLTYDANYGDPKVPVRADVFDAKESRGNLYFPSASGLWKVSTAADTLLMPTGLSVSEVGMYWDFVNGTALATNQQVAYRYVTTKTDINGVVLRSRPSGAFTVANTGGTRTPRLVFSYSTAAGAPAFDAVEVYRTRVFPTTVQADDEMQLVATFTRAQFTGTAPSYSYELVDTVPDINRGMTLYTSPSRGGMENANDRPPGAACVERFQGCLFFGNIVGPQRYVFSYVFGGDCTGKPTGIGIRAGSGTATNGSKTITAVNTTVGVLAGQLLQTSSNPKHVVQSVTASTITTVAPLTVSGAVTFQTLDALKLPTGETVPLQWSPSGLPTSFAVPSGYTVYEVTPPVAGMSATVVFEKTARGDAAFDMRASRGNEMSPPLELPSSATPGKPTIDVQPHGIAWSEPDEPEHAPPRNYAKVGDAGKSILVLCATKDSLFILKEDGIYRLTGINGQWRIDPFDNTALCILPTSVRRLQNVVYALTNVGLIAIAEGGAQLISDPIRNELSLIVDAIRASFAATGLYRMPGLVGMAGAVDESSGEYLLALGSSTPSFGGHVLVYSAVRGGFTTYTFEYGDNGLPVALGISPLGQPFVMMGNKRLEVSTTLSDMTCRVAAHGFVTPELTGKLWTHILLGLSRLTGTSNVRAGFSSSEAMIEPATVREMLSVPMLTDVQPFIQLPAGSLLRHPVPRACRRGWLLRVEFELFVYNGTFVLELIGAESREDIPNKTQTHGTGAT